MPFNGTIFTGPKHDRFDEEKYISVPHRGTVLNEVMAKTVVV